MQAKGCGLCPPEIRTKVDMAGPKPAYQMNDYALRGAKDEYHTGLYK